MTETRFIFDTEQQRMLRELQEFYGLDSMSAVLAKAISLLKLASDVQERGGELVIKSHGRETRVDLS